jgi:hypothetical protein
MQHHRKQILHISVCGTGGHTEYAKIWNSAWNVMALWNGYQEDCVISPFGESIVYAKSARNLQLHHSEPVPIPIFKIHKRSTTVMGGGGNHVYGIQRRERSQLQ